MYPNIPGFPIDNQTLMIGLGIVGFILISLYLFKKKQIPDPMVNRILVICIIAGFCMLFSARFFDDLWHNIDDGFFKNFSSNVKALGFFKALSTWQPYGITYLGGFYGAFIGFIVSFWFIIKSKRHKMFEYLDLVIPGLVLAHSLGRFGCFLVGCCYGIHAPEPFGVIFHSGDSVGLGTVLPTNLYEAIFLLGLFFFLLFGIKKNQTRYYMVIYGVFRFALEFIRGDSRGASFIPFLTPSQLLSLIILIVGICLFIWGDKLNTYIEKKWTREPKTNK